MRNAYGSYALRITHYALQPMSIQLRKATIWLIALTGLSYFLAYLRDAEVAALYGASPVTDAFFVGTFLPATLYTIVIIGSFVPALLPVLSSVVVQSPESKVQSHGGLEAGVVVATSRWLVLSMLALVAVGELMAPWLIIILAPGFDAATADMATLFLRASLPILVFLGPAALAGAVLNFRHNFVAPALGSLVFAGTVFASVPMSGQGKLWVVSLAMVVGAALQLTLNVWALDPTMRRAVLAIWMSGDKEHARRVARLALPMLLCVALTQAMLLIERLLASSFPSGVLSHMAYAAKF